MFDLSLGKLFVLGLIALFLVGPERLPRYAAELGRWVQVLRSMLDDAKHRAGSELGEGFEDVDWQRLDPRRYTPRRLLQDAWNDAGPEGAAERVLGLERSAEARRAAARLERPPAA